MSDAPEDPEVSRVSGGASSSAAQEYTVLLGESLSKIAEHLYGDASLWPFIHKANADLIKNPDLIQPGWVLTIPPRP